MKMTTMARTTDLGIISKPIGLILQNIGPFFIEELYSWWTITRRTESNGIHVPTYKSINITTICP